MMIVISERTFPLLFCKVLRRVVEARAAGVDHSSLDATESYTAGLCSALGLTGLRHDEERGASYVTGTPEAARVLKRLDAGVALVEVLRPFSRAPRPARRLLHTERGGRSRS